MFPSALLLFGLASIFQCTLQIPYAPHQKIMLFDDSFELKYHVLLQRRLNQKFFCGGSIINRLFVLTAAECVVDRRIDDIIVNAYFKDLDHSYSFFPRYVTHIFIHHGYTSLKPWHNDIALLKINACYPGTHLSRVFLTNSYDTKKLTEMTSPLLAKVTGFGITSEFQPPASRQLLKAYTLIYDWSYCKELFRRIQYNISESHVCASDPYNLANVGEPRTSDVGSALVLGTDTLVGIALSANMSVRSYNTPFFSKTLLFTNTTAYRDWIYTHIIENLLDDGSLGFPLVDERNRIVGIATLPVPCRALFGTDFPSVFIRVSSYIDWINHQLFLSERYNYPIL